jgi:hypothetical protein
VGALLACPVKRKTAEGFLQAADEIEFHAILHLVDPRLVTQRPKPPVYRSPGSDEHRIDAAPRTRDPSSDRPSDDQILSIKIVD